MKFIITILISVLSIASEAGSVSKNLDSLGANKSLVRKAQKLNPRHKVAVVQKRSVDRRSRFELGLQYGTVAGGDPYLNTSSLGGALDFHISPVVSIGARYANYDNDLTAEGKRVFDLGERSSIFDNPVVPEIDHPVDSTMGTLTIYPFYGKLSVLQSSIVQFDLYGLVGYGQMRLKSGSTGTHTIGGGIGAWISNNITSRLEFRYQGFEDVVSTGKRNVNWTFVSASVGILI